MNKQNQKFKNHDFLTDNSSNEKKTWIVMIITFITMFAEIIVGYFSGSMALLADGWHMATHVGAFIITIFAYRYARKYAQTGRFSYGIGKVNVLAGFSSAVALGVVGLFMIVESITRFFSPHEIAYNEAIIVAIIGLVINGISALLLGHNHNHSHPHYNHSHENCHHNHEHEHHHEKEVDYNLKSAYFHVLADAITSILAIVALLVASKFGLTFLDPLMGIVGALVIGKWAYGLIKDTAPMLLDEESIEISNKIKEVLEKEDCQITDLHCWSVSPKKYAVSISVKSNNLTSLNIREIISSKVEVSHIVVEVN